MVESQQKRIELVTRHGDDQYSLMHAKLFGGWNALVCDPWDADAVYALEATSESILQVVDATGQGKRPEVEEVWSSPEPSPSPGSSGHLSFCQTRGWRARHPQSSEKQTTSPFCTNAQSRFALAVFDGVLRHPHIARHT